MAATVGKSPGTMETKHLVLGGVEGLISLDRQEANVLRRMHRSRTVKNFMEDQDGEINLDDLDHFPKTLHRYMDQRMGIVTVKSKADGWLMNLRANLPRLVVARDHQDFKGIEGPCIVAGGSSPATPLIASQFSLLHEAKMPVVACDRAFQVLCPRGRKHRVPEYVCILENNRDPNYEYLFGEGRRKLTKDITLYSSPITHPDILAAWKGDILYYTCDFPWQMVNFCSYLDLTLGIKEDGLGLPKLWHGGNVGTLSYTLAIFLRGNPVGLVGMDFGQEVVEPSGRRRFVTDPVLFSYATGLLEIVRTAALQKVETYNCTEGGILRSRDIQERSLASFLEEYDG